MRDATKQVDNDLLIPVPKHSRQNLDSQTMTTINFGNICPIFAMETVPGGTYDIQTEMLARFQPLVSPVMHKMSLKAHYYFVPYRILWDNWENFIMQKKDIATGEIPVHPFFSRVDCLTTATTNGKTSPLLADYFGLKASAGTDTNMNPFVFAAYQMIWAWYYRHKSVEDDPLNYKLQDGEVLPSTFALQLAAIKQITFESDYFNDSLPTPQEGYPMFVDADASIYGVGTDYTLSADPVDIDLLGRTPNPNDQVEGDMFARVRIRMEEIRRAERLQEYLELNNHARTYIDFLKAHYNVDLQDYRLGIPEYITGFSQPVMVSDVTNQSDNFQGRIVGNGMSYAQSPKNSYYAREHGVIIGVAACTYKPTYLHAIPRLLTKTNWDDYFNPRFDNLGEQGLKNVELHAAHDEPDAYFGYVPKYHEYRNSFDMTTGEARTVLQHWHLARSLNTDVKLTRDFFNVVDERRIFAYQNDDFDPIILQVYNNIQALLPMGEVSRPQL